MTIYKLILKMSCQLNFNLNNKQIPSQFINLYREKRFLDKINRNSYNFEYYSNYLKTMNSLIVKELTTLGHTEKEAGNKYKSLAYLKAAKNIGDLKEDVKSGEEAKKLPGIGDSIAKKIDEIIQTKKLQRNLDDNKDEKRQALKFLTSVHGIGDVRALELYMEYNITNSEELKNCEEVLNSQQIIGMKYYEELKLKIPRSEMEQIISVLTAYRDIIDKDIILTACGSYRRGKMESGDIDILLTRKDWKTGEERPKSMDKFIQKLVKIKFLTDELGYGEKKYMGVCCLTRKLLGIEKGTFIHRRIDIRFIPYDSYYFGLLYFTGSGEFNVRMRQHALDKGYTLNEYRICKVKKQQEQVKIESEKDIFTAIGMEYVSPKNR